MYIGKTFMARTKEELLSPPFVLRFEQYINNTIAPMKKQYNIPETKVIIKQGCETACTDGFSIIIGSQMAILTNPYVSLNQASLIVLGLVFHEMGHILYTPFSAINFALNSFKAKHFWPVNPDSPYTETVLDYLDKDASNLGKMFSIYRYMQNIFEDGRIEAILLLKNGHRGKYAYGLRLLRQKHYKLLFKDISDELNVLDSMPDGDEKTAFKMQLFMNSLLTVAKYGTFKGLHSKHEMHPFVNDINNLSDYISNMLDSVNATEFYENLNMLFVKSFNSYIKPYLDTLPSTEEVDELFSSIKSVTSDDVDKTSDATAKKIEESTKAVKKALIKSSKPELMESSEHSPSDETSDSDKDEAETSSSSHTHSEDTETESSETPAEDKDLASDNIWSGDEGCIDELDDMHDDTYELDLEAIGKTSVSFESKEDEILDSLETCKSLHHSSSNYGLKIGVTRVMIPSVSVSYESYKSYISAGKLAAKKIKPFLKMENKTFYERNRFSGSRFKASKVANPNLRYFDKKTSIPKSPTLSVVILVDQSGSMDGSNIEIARATAISLFEMCSELEISFAVFGHSADMNGYDVLIDNYCYFGESQERDKRKLLKIHAGGNNRDGAALRYVSEILAKQPTEKKLLFVISDGQPAAFGYSGQLAKNDIQEVIKEYERAGIRFIAAAIDADKAQIKDIYEAHRFLNIDNVETLPTKLQLVIKKTLSR